MATLTEQDVVIGAGVPLRGDLAAEAARNWFIRHLR